jgi:hypothetical protein
LKNVWSWLFCFVPLLACPLLYAQKPDSPSGIAAQSKRAKVSLSPEIDPEKDAAIHRVMQLTGSETIQTDLANEMKGALRLPVENSLPPGEYRGELVDLLLEKFGTRFATEVVVPKVVSVYAKLFSADDLKQLIAFYESPLGKKMSSVLAEIDTEAQNLQGPAEDLMQDCMAQVLADHPDLEKAMERAHQAHGSDSQPQK